MPVFLGHYVVARQLIFGRFEAESEAQIMEATSKQAVVGFLYEHAEENFPTREGWTKPQINVKELSADVLRQLATHVQPEPEVSDDQH
jgi:hypothetical protein